MVMARTYNWKGTTVNPKKITSSGDLNLNICENQKIETYITMDDKEGYASKLFNKTVNYTVSDSSLATVSSDGIIEAKDKEGSLSVTIRTCNGKQCSFTVTISDYTKPKTFSGYKGEFQDINLLLRDYRNDLTEIAHYLTIHRQNGNTDRKDGKVLGTLSYDSETQQYVNHLMSYPGNLYISCDEDEIQFSIIDDGG